MNELFSVKDKVVVITGGTGVLGTCISEYLALQGAKVVIWDAAKKRARKSSLKYQPKAVRRCSLLPTL